MDTSPLLGDRLYIASSDGELYGLSETDGTEQFVLDARLNNSTSSAMVEDADYIGDRSGLSAFDPASGEHPWSHGTEGWIRPPAVADGTMFVALTTP